MDPAFDATAACHAMNHFKKGLRFYIRPLDQSNHPGNSAQQFSKNDSLSTIQMDSIAFKGGWCSTA
jgi:hypothetical protein